MTSTSQADARYPWVVLSNTTLGTLIVWAGIYIAPIIAGFVVTGPLSGALGDRFGVRAFATIALILTAVGFVALSFLPVDFALLPFLGILAFLGCTMGLFVVPNTTAIMDAVPAGMRSVASGMRATIDRSARMASAVLFFSLLTAGLGMRLPAVMRAGLISHGLPAKTAASIAGLRPITVLFAAFLGYNPMRRLIPADVRSGLSPHECQALFGRSFFPHLITPAFADGMHVALWAAAALSLAGALASSLRGARYVEEG